MKLTILICTIALFGAGFGETIEEAQNRAQEYISNFTTDYSDLFNSELYTSIYTKVNNFQMDYQQTLNANNDKIRVLYDPFYTLLTTTNQNNVCYSIAKLNLYLDVERGLYYSEGSSKYTTLMYTLESFPSSEISNGMYAVTGPFMSAYQAEYATIDSINEAIQKFQMDSCVYMTHARALLSAVATLIDQLITKFNTEDDQRATDAINKLELIKLNYDSCTNYGYYL